jgi:hypothetical protein
MAVAGVAAFAAAAAGIGVRASYGAQVTGDEPQYLITAISLGKDGDLDVSDEISERAYLPFHEVGLDRQTQPEPGGREVSPHDPLLPALLAVPTAVGGWVAAKLTLAASAGALAALLVWIAVVRFGVPVKRTAIVVSALAASAPFAVYGQQVYPEIVAALAVGVGVACLTGPLRASGLMGAAGSVVVLPWLSVKYAPVAASLAALLVWSLWRQRRLRACSLVLLAWTAAAVLFVLTHLWWYGGITPYAAGDHFVHSGELGVVGFDPNYAGRSVRLVGLLVDDVFGLAAWQPAWLLAIPALASLVKTRPSGWGVLALPLSAGWLSATFLAPTMHGWWWPGRQVVVVLPCAVLAIAWWAGKWMRRTAITGALAALGMFIYAWIVVEGLAGNLTWVIDFHGTSNPVYQWWVGLLPAYSDPNAQTWILHGLWIAAALVLVAWCSLSSRNSIVRRTLFRSWIPIPTRSRT